LTAIAEYPNNYKDLLSYSIYLKNERTSPIIARRVRLNPKVLFLIIYIMLTSPFGGIYFFGLGFF